MWKQLFQATWKNFRAEFSGLLANLQRHGRLVESQANLLEFEQLFREMEKARTAAEADYQCRTIEEERHRRITVRNWLSAASVDTDQEKGVNARKDCPGSGRWLLEHNCMQAWFNMEFCATPLLWLSGIPGAGLVFFYQSWQVTWSNCRKDSPCICDCQGIPKTAPNTSSFCHFLLLQEQGSRTQHFHCYCKRNVCPIVTPKQ